MKKNIKLTNILIKRKLRSIIQEEDLRINNESLSEIDKIFLEKIIGLVNSLKHDLELSGRNTVKIEDIHKVANRQKAKNDDFEL